MNAISAEIYGFLVGQSTHLAVLFFVIWGLVSLCHGKSAHLRYLLWAVILVKCLLPPVFTIPVAVLPGPVVTSPVVEPAEGPAESSVLQTANSPVLQAVEPVVTTSVDLSTMTPSPVIELQVPDRAAWWRTLETRQRVLLVWGAGVVVILLGTCVRAMRFAGTLRRSRVEIDDVLSQKIGDLSQRFRPGLTVQAYQLEGTGQPFVWGIFKGAIYLPANFCQTSTEHKRCSVLLHELAHVARLDPLVNFIQIVTQALYWFHPLVWVANKKIRAEREKCCDEIAIARFDTTPKEYGSAIVDTLTQEYESRMAVPTLAVAGPVKNIEDRIRTIMRPGKQFYSQPTFKALAIILVLAVVTIATAVALTERTYDAKDDVLHHIEGHQIRLTPIDREGHEYDASYSSGSLGSRMSVNGIEPGPVIGISKDDKLAKFKLESRPYYSVRIGNVFLSPNTNTDRADQPINRGPMAPGSSFMDMDLTEVLDILGDETGVPIVADADVRGVTSAEFDAVPLEVALDLVLAGTDYSWSKKDGVYLVSVVPRKDS
ncbi:MAG: hypothetical protein GY809_15975, partial [Planctomycetes bacterium]|nr:hypothetical protein [Planctomycetota bacterium]